MSLWLTALGTVAALNAGTDAATRESVASTETVTEPSPRVTALMRRLESQDGCLEAIAELGDLGPAAAAAAPRIGRFLQDPDWNHRVTAAVALYQMGCGARAATADLVAALGDSQGDVRAGASLALCRIGGPAVPALIKGLNHPDKFGRQRAAETLGRIGGPAKAALPALERALSDGDEGVRRSVRTAIRRIQGEKEDKKGSD